MCDNIHVGKEMIIRFLVGGFSGMISKSVLCPMDRIKLILQNQDSYAYIQTGTHMRYRGFFDAIARIPQEQGFLSLWRGNWASIIRYFPQQALNFSIYNYVAIHTPSRHLSYLPNKLVAGAVSGGLTTIILYPLYYCQTRIAVDLGSRKGKKGTHQRHYTGVCQCVTSTVKRGGGLPGLYEGLYPSVIGYAVYKSLFFSIFDYGKLLMVSQNKDVAPTDLKTIAALFGIAQIASAGSSVLSYPLDTISRRMMLQSGKPADLREYTGMISCALKLYKKSGVKVFFAGNVTNLVRSLGSALVLVLNDAFLHAIGFDTTVGL